MNLKKILSGFLAAAMAVTTMVTVSVTASADAETLVDLGNSHVTAKSIVVTYDLLSTEAWANATLTFNYGAVDDQSDYFELGLGGADQEKWFQKETQAFILFDGTPIRGGKYTYDLKCVPDKWFEVLYEANANTDCMINTIEIFDGTNGTGESLYEWTNPDMDTTKYADQVIANPPANEILSTFDASKINGNNAKIIMTWTSNANDNGIQIQNEAGDNLATFSGWGTVGSVTKEVLLSDFTLPEKIKLNVWGVASIESMTIHNDQTKGNVYTPAPSIGARNFTYSTTKNTSMKIGDKFTVTFDSVVDGIGIPDGAVFDIKFKIPKIENATNPSTDFDYFAPVENSVLDGTAGQTVTGLKVTSEESGTKTIFTFEAVSASTCKYPFLVVIETLVGETRDYLSYPSDMGYMVLASAHTITVTKPTNGTVTATPTTAAKDETVTLTVTPATGYELDVLTVKEKTSGAAVTVAADNTFTMPDDDVTVTATFKAPLTAIDLDETATVLVGAEKTLTAMKVPSYTTDTTAITWSSSDETVATVASDGTVTGVKAGTATITATCGTKSASCEVTVTAEAKPCTSVTLDKTTAEVTTGKTVTLKATTLPQDTTDNITWTTSNSAVATVTGGVVTGVAEGTATITVTCGTKTATCEVTVAADTTPCTGVALDKTTAEVLKGKTVMLTATATPADTTDEITWASSDTSIATVTNGVVTGVARGIATITVTCGTKTATCEVSVNEEETVTAPSSPSEPAKTFSSAVTDGKYNENDVFVISAADVAAATSVTVTVTDSNGKKTTKDVTECYKKVTHTAADGTTDTITAGSNYLLAVTVTGIPEGTTVTVTVTVNK